MTTENNTSETTFTTGQISGWDSTEKKKKGNFNSAKLLEEYMNLEEGSNCVRILGLPWQYVTHHYKHAAYKGKGKGTKVKCTKDPKTCKLCKDGFETEERWYLPVIDRKTSMLKALEIGWGLFQKIKVLNSSKKGNPQNYDIDIIVNRGAEATNYYNVIPDDKESLSVADLELKKSFENNPDFLGKKVAPLTAESMVKKLEFLDNPGKKFTPKGASATSEHEATPTEGISKEADQFEFPEA